ncbi:MAG: insulinase family protein [Thermoleophilia bacterium]|nr:insulinase family protein [Thermoleophilia bacterium]
MALGVWIAAGSRLEPPELGGVSHFIEHLVFKGSARFSAWDIAHIFDDMGAEPNAATSKEHTIVHVRCLDEDLDRAFEVLAEMVARPSFADLDHEREVVLEEVAMYEDSPPELVHDDLARAVFGDHPLGRPIIGHTATLAGLDDAVVRSYHDAHYVNPGIVIAAAGHVDHARLCDLTSRHFRPEPGAEVPRPVLGPPDERHVASFAEKDTEQYHICLGGPGPRRADPDRWAVFVADAILGGSWSSRLFQEVRERRGLAYSVYSYTSLYADAGLTAVYLGSREGAVTEALSVTLDVLGRLSDEVTEESVSRARNHLKGQLALNHESVTSRMQSLGRSVLLELPVLSLDEIVAHVDAVSRDDVLAAVARYYAPERWSAVCIGPDAAPFKALTEDFTWEER